MPMLGRHLLKHIECNRMLNVGRIKIDNLFDAGCRHEVKNFFSELAVRVNYCHATACLNVIDYQILKERCFTHASFANHVYVPAAIVRLNPKFLLLVSEIGFSKWDYF